MECSVCSGRGEGLVCDRLLDLSRYNIYWMFFKVTVIMIINKVKILYNYIYNICRYITI